MSFPASPATNQSYTAANGTVWTFTGTRWSPTPSGGGSTTDASTLTTGTLGSARLPAFGSGDAAVAVAGGAITIQPGVVTPAKMSSLSGLSATQAQSIASAIAGDATAKAAVIGATSIDALADVDTTTATPTNGQTLVWNGANWVPGASAPGSNAVTNAMLATAPPNTLKGNNAVVTGNEGDLTASQALGVLATIATGDANLKALATKLSSSVGVVANAAATGSISLDLSAGDVFDLTTTGNITLNALTNGTDGKAFIVRIHYSGTHTVSLNASAFNHGVASIAYTSAATKSDDLVYVYRSATAKAELIGFNTGF